MIQIEDNKTISYISNGDLSLFKKMNNKLDQIITVGRLVWQKD